MEDCGTSHEHLFSRGDRVRLIDSHGDVPHGAAGRVIGRYADDEALLVVFDNSVLGSLRVHAGDLELANQAGMVRLSSSLG